MELIAAAGLFDFPEFVVPGHQDVDDDDDDQAEHLEHQHEGHRSVEARADVVVCLKALEFPIEIVVAIGIIFDEA